MVASGALGVIGGSYYRTGPRLTRQPGVGLTGWDAISEEISLCNNNASSIFLFIAATL